MGLSVVRPPPGVALVAVVGEGEPALTAGAGCGASRGGEGRGAVAEPAGGERVGGRLRSQQGGEGVVG